MTDYRLILRLLLRGKSYRDIESQAGCSHRTIAKAKAVANTRHLTTPTDLDAYSDEQIHSWFADGRRTVTEKFLTPDFDSIIKARRFEAKPTMRNLWLDYCTTQAPDGTRHYGFDRFRELINDYITTHDLVAMMQHEPGHTMQVDWAGTLLELADLTTGKPVKLHVFVAYLPYSGMVTASAHHNERSAAWLDGHRQAFEYFGGATTVIIPDNATTASNQITAGDRARDVNATYEAFLAWYNTAADPTRSRKPRDKGAVEAGVKVITRSVIAVLQGSTFVDLDEINERIDELIDEINTRTPFRRRDVSRREIFTADEHGRLHRLPATPFEKVTWYKRVVARDFHVEVARVRYSVPYAYAGRDVDIRVVGSTLSVLADNEVIATHQVSPRAGAYVTDTDHEPDYFAEYKNLWSRAYFLRQGAKIGPSTRKVLEDLLDSQAIEAQAFRPCRNILDLGKTHANAQVLEAACAQMISDTGRRRAISFTAVKNAMAIVRAAADQRPTTSPPNAPSRQTTVTRRDTATAHLAGPEAFSMEAIMQAKGAKK